MTKHPRCDTYQERAMQVLGGGPATLSKHASRYPQGLAPSILVRGEGAQVWCPDGHTYIDTVAALGPIILGHSDAAVNLAVMTQMDHLASSTLSTPLETDVAEMLCARIPGAEQVRFAVSGKDVTEAAIKLARHVTGKRHVVYCYSPDTEILTQERGFVEIPNLMLGERVATLNPESGVLEFHPIERLIAKEFHGNMIHFFGDRVDLMVTPDHKVFTGKKTTRKQVWGKYRLVDAESLLSIKSPRVMTSACEWSGDELSVIEIPKVQSLGKTKGLTSFCAKTFMKFLGYFVTEGCVAKSKRPYYHIRLAQKPGYKHDEIVATILEMGFSPYVYGDKIEFSSKELWLYLKDFGDGARNKRIPTHIKSLSSSLLDVMFQAMIDGDGTRENGNPRKFYTTSPSLRDDLCEVALKVGYSSTTSLVSGNGFSGGEIYHISLSKKHTKEIWAKNIEEVSYSGLVHCLTVKNHIVMTRRNGRMVWSGNCGYHGGFSDYLITTDKTGGLLPSLVNWNHQVPWRDFGAVEALLYGNTPLAFQDDLAAIILEVPPEYPGITVEGTTAILERYKGIARDRGALFILDEIVTGLRYGIGGAQALYGVDADLVTMSKALGNGVPIAALMGQRDLMQEFEGGHVFLSTTFGANPLGLAAAKATLLELDSKTHGWCVLQAHGQSLYDGLRVCMARWEMPGRLKGNFARMVVEWDPVPDVATAAELHTLWLQETVKQGILFGVPIFPMCAYTDDTVKRILAAADTAMDTIRFTLDHAAMTAALDVPVIGTVFERYATQALPS